MSTTSNIERDSSRHFYAVKENNRGQVIPYGFSKIASRNEWLSKNDNAKPVSAFEVYQMLNKQSNEVLAVNRLNRVFKTTAKDVDVEKGHKLIRN